MPWRLAVDLDETVETPVYARIAQAIADDISRGRLGPGERLPGTRTLAESLGVHRNTVVAAYRELVSQGWAQTHRASATVVSPTMPERVGRPLPAPLASLAKRTGFALGERPPTRTHRADRVAFDLSRGMPDPRLAPHTVLARAMGRVLRRSASRSAVLDYGDRRGHPALRRELAAMLSRTRGLAVDEDDVVVTRGSQMALYLVGGALISPGDRVAAECFGYPPAWRAFEAHGAAMVSTKVDEEGLQVSRLRDAAPPRAVYLTPHHQYPTTVTLSAARRLELLRWATENRVAIVEDDYDNEYHYEGRPLLPLAASDRSGVVVYVGTLSKVVAPGLRIGWIVAPRNLLERVVELRTVIDGQGALPTEAAIAELLEEGEIQRHIWRTKREFATRRDTLVAALHDALAGVLDFRMPPGGMALWCRVDPDIDVERWRDAAAHRGVAFGVGRDYRLDGRRHNAIRLAFARHTPDELREAVVRLADALSELRR